MTGFNDYLGKPINPGDFVVSVYGGYMEFNFGVIHSFANKSVRITKRNRNDRTPLDSHEKHTIVIDPRKVVVVND